MKKMHIFSKAINTEKQFFHILVTATMSAGKSTLINTLIGKNIARTAQSVCTGNLCYIYNQSVDDGKVIFYSENQLNLDADNQVLQSFDWINPVSITCYFRNVYCSQQRVCLIDTPGVNAAINPIHGEITRNAILNQTYQLLIHVLNANKLGSDSEISYLIWMKEHLPQNRKIIFVLNKLDDFKLSEDNIPESIASVKKELCQIGFLNPIVCPVSAYFGFLLKKKLYQEQLKHTQQIDFDYLTDKFRNPEYDLSRFYSEKADLSDKNPDEILYCRCGMAALEKIIFSK